YWLRFIEPEIVPLGGVRILNMSLALKKGWNLISGTSCDMALEQLRDPDSILIPGTLYAFDQSYYPSDSIKQGYGYWLRTLKPGNISIECQPEFTNNSRLKKNPVQY